jgi:hypothetical protein
MMKIISAILFLLCTISLALAIPQQINYQGFLTRTSGTPLDTTVAMTFKLYADSLAGSLLWTEARPAVTVQSGLFSVRLGEVTILTDAMLNNPQIWLGIAVGTNSEMSPRIRMVSVAYSYRTGTVDGATGGMITGNTMIVGKCNIGGGLNSNAGVSAFVAGVANAANGDNSAVGGGQNNTATGQHSVIGGGLLNSTPGQQSVVGGGTSNIVTGNTAAVGGGSGNIASGTLSTIGGGNGNTASAQSATVGGGEGNFATNYAATVSGGSNNTAASDWSTVSGGQDNVAATSKSTVSGGRQNLALGFGSVVSGGQYNRTRADFAVVGGGGSFFGADSNSARGEASVIPGGRSNQTAGIFSLAAGYRAKALSYGSFVWGDSTAGDIATTGPNQFVVRSKGGTYIYSNSALNQGVFLPTGSSCWRPMDSTAQCGRVDTALFAGHVGTVDGATGGLLQGDITSGTHNTRAANWTFIAGDSNRVSGDYSTIAGGQGNRANNLRQFIGGGLHNNADGSVNFIGGGDGNHTSGDGSVVVGGIGNQANNLHSFIGGGQNNIADGTSNTIIAGESNRTSGNFGTIGGGRFNRARGDYSFVGGGGGDLPSDSNSARAIYSVIGGGLGNDIPASGQYSAICAGDNNIADNIVSFIGGGYGNRALGFSSTVCGGYQDSTSAPYATISGGDHNVASGGLATIGGGYYNSAGDNATVPGGANNTASGGYSFAAGIHANATHTGSFVWNGAGDITQSWGNSTFTARAPGGVRFYTDVSATNIGASLAAGSGAWTSLSDSTTKRNRRDVDTKTILDKVNALPIQQWSYKSQDPCIEHIGPMAQDFWKQFHVGEDSLTISTIDPSGIALAAIQELAKENQELKATVADLGAMKKEIALLRSIVERMAASLPDAQPTEKAVYTPMSRPLNKGTN